uniref:Uncharacterized protein n=1 Tax=Picea glauca TaxID=3330 RepID=A0A101M3U7_PICGL|nr:hypothetical protein ABT39_MTgene260 [Picea glauca]
MVLHKSERAYCCIITYIMKPVIFSDHFSMARIGKGNKFALNRFKKQRHSMDGAARPSGEGFFY